MTLKEAMDYRGKNETTLAEKMGSAAGYVRRWCRPGGVLITEDGAEFELYGSNVR